MMERYKVIIVENDEDEQFFMKQGFDKSGHFEIIAQVPNGNALFEWLAENQANLPDLILSDLNMPGKNGNDIIAAIKHDPLYQHIPVVITSTSATPTIIDRCLNQGAADYIVKPETFVDYLPFVNELHKKITEKQLVKTMS
jgi:CheY-like chemotaxis protein